MSSLTIWLCSRLPEAWKHEARTLLIITAKSLGSCMYINTRPPVWSKFCSTQPRLKPEIWKKAGSSLPETRKLEAWIWLKFYYKNETTKLEHSSQFPQNPEKSAIQRSFPSILFFDFHFRPLKSIGNRTDGNCVLDPLLVLLPILLSTYILHTVAWIIWSPNFSKSSAFCSLPILIYYNKPS